MAAATVIPEPAAPVAELAVVPAPPVRLSLYALNEELIALMDTMEMVPSEQEGEFLERFAQTLAATAEKIDSTSHFMAFLDSQITLSKTERTRLQEREEACQRILDRLDRYLTQIIKSRGQDAKNKWRKLEGRVTSFGLKKCPPSVEITDPEQVAAEHKSVTITLPLPLYDKLLDSLDLDFAGEIADAVSKAKIDVSKTSVKDALKGGTIPGARLIDDKYKLVRT